MAFKHAGLETQVKKVPQEVLWCKKCTISNQRPQITFNEEEICSACINAEYKNKI